MSFAPTDLRCEYLRDPVGLGATAPRFSWRLPATDASATQQAYEVEVAESTGAFAASDGPKLWTTGRVASATSVHVRYAGPPLSSGQRYFWRVRVWDAANECSAWSDVAHWVTGIMDPVAWEAADWIGLPVDSEPAPALLDLIAAADWIALPREVAVPEGCNTNVAFRQEVAVPPGGIAQAWLVAGSSSNLVFDVNQRPIAVCQGHRPAVAVNVTDLLTPGANVLAATIVHEGRSAVPIALRAALQIHHHDGRVEVCRTDGSWRVAVAPPFAWKQCGFADLAWSPAQCLAEGELGLGAVEQVVDEHRSVPAVYLRRDWSLPAGATEAVLHVLGLGYHEVYINGQRVGDHVLDPGLTDYRKRVLSVTHDVFPLVRPGRNVVGVILGNGRFFAPRRRMPVPTIHFGSPRLRLLLEWRAADGTRQRLCSDRRWFGTTDGPILANNDYDGESYDARREQADWCDVGFEAGPWKPVQVYAPLAARPVAQMAEPVRVTERLPARQVRTVSPGVHIVDFGQNVVGWVRLRVRGERGTCVRLRHAERLTEDGRLSLAGLRSCRVTDEYTLRGGGEEVYEPRFTYHGFRYVELTGLGGRPGLDDVEACVVHTDAERVGDFRCSDPIINRVFENFVWGVRGNLRSVPTDCPQRDERHGWLGDIANISKGENYVFRTVNFYRKWLADIRDAQRDDGNLPDLAPPYWDFYSGNVTWPAAYVVIAGWLYEQFGDRDILREHYPAMCRWLAHLRKQYDGDLLRYDTYGDWCVPPESPELIHSEDPNRHTDGTLLAMATHVHVLRLVARMARVLDEHEDAARFDAEAATVATRYHEHFYDSDRWCYGNGTQTSFALSLSFGLVPEHLRPHVAAAFGRRVRDQDGGHIATGLVGGQWLLRALDDCGHGDLALQMAQQRDYPSWGYMVERGATTLWELWNGDTADPTMNSHNHLMLAGDLPIWLFERLAGIQAQWDTPGYARFVLAPRFAAGLAHVAAHHETIRGTIRSAWQRTGSIVAYRATVPPTSSAELRLDASGVAIARVALDGHMLWEHGSPTRSELDLRTEPAGPVLALPPGSYVFEIEQQPAV